MGVVEVEHLRWLHEFVSAFFCSVATINMGLYATAALWPRFRNAHPMAARLSAGTLVYDLGMIWLSAYWLIEWGPDGVMLAATGGPPPLPPMLARLLSAAGLAHNWWCVTALSPKAGLLRIAYVGVAVSVALTYACLAP